MPRNTFTARSSLLSEFCISVSMANLPGFTIETNANENTLQLHRNSTEISLTQFAEPPRYYPLTFTFNARVNGTENITWPTFSFKHTLSLLCMLILKSVEREKGIRDGLSRKLGSLSLQHLLALEVHKIR